MKITLDLRLADTEQLLTVPYTDPFQALEAVRTLMAGNEPNVLGFQFTVEGLHDDDPWIQGGQVVH